MRLPGGGPVVKGVKDVGELGCVEAVQAGDDGVEFLDHRLFRGGVEGSVLDAHRGGPGGEAVVGRGEAAGKGDGALPVRVAARRAGDGEVTNLRLTVD